MTARLKKSPEVDEWLSRCPLRLWYESKTDKRDAFQKLMKRTGVKSKSAIYAWMYGLALPHLDRMYAMRPMTNITVEKWLKWWKQKPLGDSPCLVPNPIDQPFPYLTSNGAENSE